MIGWAIETVKRLSSGSDPRLSAFALRASLIASLVAAALSLGLLGPTHALARAEGTAPSEASPAPPTATCETAEALLQGGRTAQAEEAFLEALKTADGLQCAPPALAALSDKNLCNAADTIAEKGFETEATAAYVERIKLDPSSQCAREGLAELGEQPIWDELKATADDAIAVLGLIAATAALILLALVLLAIPMSRSRRLKEMPPARWFVRPTVAVEAFGDEVNDPKLGPGFAAFVRTALQSGRGDTRLTHLAPGKVTTSDPWASRLEAAGDQAKAVGSLVDLALLAIRRRDFQASGELQSSHARGAGVSISLNRDRSYVDGVHFWASELRLPTTLGGDGHPDLVRRLAVPAAAWISHRALSEGETPPAQTGDAMSWALYQAGLDHERRGEFLDAWLLVERALDRDPANYAAKIYRGLVLLELQFYPEAVRELLDAVDVVER